MTRNQLLEAMLPKMYASEDFRLLRGYTLGELKVVMNLILNARNESAKELKDGRAGTNPSA